MVIDYEFLESFCDQVLIMDHSIRWVGVVNDNGVILSSKRRAGLVLKLTQEENEEYAISAISRHKTRTRFEAKIGRLKFALGRYEGLNRATIPVNLHFYLLITLDKEEKNSDSIIMDKIYPIIEDNGNRFLDLSIEERPSAEYESGTFRCLICAKEFMTKADADCHHALEHKEESVHANE